MTSFSLPAPRLAGIVSALPAHSEANADLADRFGAEAIAKIIAATGIVGLGVGLAVFVRRWPKVAVHL